MPTATAVSTLPPYIDHSYGLVLRAIAHEGSAAVQAYEEWRDGVSLSAVPVAQHRAFPLLADLVAQHAIADADYERLRGVGRNLWARNTAKLHGVQQTLDLLAQEKISPILFSGLALLAQNAVRIDSVALGPLELLVTETQFLAAQQVFKANAYQPEPEKSGQESASWHAPTGKCLIVLRLSPVPNLTNRRFVQNCAAASRVHQFQDRSARVMSPTHQLFCALAQPAIDDDIAGFTALLEGHALLSTMPDEIEWQALNALILLYGLQAYALAYFGFLAQYTPHPIPSAVMASLHAAVGRRDVKEWVTNKHNSSARSLTQDAMKAFRDLRFSRHNPSTLIGKIMRGMKRRLIS